MKTKHLVIAILALLAISGYWTVTEGETFIGWISVLSFWILVIMFIVFTVQHWNDKFYS